MTAELTKIAKMKADIQQTLRKFGGRANKVATKDIMMSNPQVDVDGIENGEERESPRNAINNCFLAFREELVYDSTEEKQVNERP